MNSFAPARRVRSVLAALVASLLLSGSAFAFQQSPVLDQAVANGELPPVDERLPSEPRIIDPINEIGQYGGTWRVAFTGRSDDRGPQKMIEARIVRFLQTSPDHFELVPGWASSFEANEDSTAFTFKIRDGLRWSDGELVTTDDVAFYFEVMESEIGDDDGSYPETLISGGEHAELDIVDDLTFTVSFSTPSPLFLQRLGRDYTWMAFPRHYMEQFTPMHASEEELAARAAEFSVESYRDLWGRFGAMQSFWLNPDVPTLSPWVVTVPPTGEVAIFERNPYYYAVDSEGNQLPYIDEIRHDLFQDAETLNLWIAQGRVDLQSRHVSIGDYPFHVENQEAGDYKVVPWRNLNVETVWPNQTTRNEQLAELFAMPEFREAINIAVDRETINEVAFAGFGTPMQAGPAPGSAILSDALLNKWIEFDPDRANELLDAIGLTERDADGYRLGRNGEPLQMTITMTTAQDVRPLELVAADWQAVGLRTTIETIERSLYLERVANRDVEIGNWPMDRAANFLIQPNAYEAAANTAWATGYGLWRDNPEGENAMKPAEGHMIYKVWELLDQAEVASSEDEAAEFGLKVLDLHAEAPYWVGLVGGAPSPFIVSNRMGNFPENYILDDLTRDIGIIPVEQIYIRQ